MPRELPTSGRTALVGYLAIAATSSLLTYYALHHGTYALAERQQLAVLAWVVVGALGVFGMAPRVEVPKPAIGALGALLLMAVWTAIGLRWTQSDERTFAEVARVLGYLGVLTLVYCVVGRRSWRLVAAGPAGAGVVVCALAVGSRLVPGVFPEDEVAAALGTNRLSYPFGYWNAVGAWAAMTLTMCLAWAAHARSVIVRAVALAAVPVVGLCLYLTISRAALGGAAIGLIALVVLGRNRWLTVLQGALAGVATVGVVLVARGKDEIVDATGAAGAGMVAVALAAAIAFCALAAVLLHRAGAGERLRLSRERARVALAIGAAVFAVAAIVVLPSLASDAWREFNQTTFATGAGAESRLTQLNGNRHNVWSSAWNAFEAEPLHGIGSGTFEFWWNRTGANGEHVRDAHSVYLEPLTETGVIGLALMAAFLAALAAASLTARRALTRSDDIGIHAGLCAVFCVFLLQAGVDWIWESTAVTLLALVAVATAGAAATRRRESVSSASAGVGLVLAAIIAVLVQLPGLATDRQINQSQAAFRDKDYREAARHAQKAVEAQPWAATPYAQRALAAQAAGDLEAARADLVLAQTKEPTNWKWPLLLITVDAKLGDRAAAQRDLERARELRPWSELFDRW